MNLHPYEAQPPIASPNEDLDFRGFAASRRAWRPQPGCTRAGPCGRSVPARSTCWSPPTWPARGPRTSPGVTHVDQLRLPGRTPTPTRTASCRTGRAGANRQSSRSRSSTGEDMPRWRLIDKSARASTCRSRRETYHTASPYLYTDLSIPNRRLGHAADRRAQPASAWARRSRKTSAVAACAIARESTGAGRRFAVPASTGEAIPVLPFRWSVQATVGARVTAAPAAVPASGETRRDDTATTTDEAVRAPRQRRRGRKGSKVTPAPTAVAVLGSRRRFVR